MEGGSWRFCVTAMEGRWVGDGCFFALGDPFTFVGADFIALYVRLYSAPESSVCMLPPYRWERYPDTGIYFECHILGTIWALCIPLDAGGIGHFVLHISLISSTDDNREHCWDFSLPGGTINTLYFEVLIRSECEFLIFDRDTNRNPSGNRCNTRQTAIKIIIIIIIIIQVCCYASS